ncbi:hypothetical protein C0V97_06285 [Asaia sp. W19]|uniref:hypothetical protein n=1 Tax=unclassified Asaia TaxID=2685023 RepID=UPI000F8CC4F3|nr:hypothetical protein [Asaia sp. W19]RUT26334.1 hypothetical protein C0V97_06285 [Asaia sp. W19]
MTKAEFETYLVAHPQISRDLERERRVWVSSLPSTQIERFTAFLGERLGMTLAFRQIEPELEFVLYDPEAAGNGSNDLLTLAQQRAGEYGPL